MTNPDNHVKFDVSSLRQRTAFFYGTLMSPQVLNRVVHGTPNLPPHEPQRFKIIPAILHDYRRHRVANADYPAIVPCANSSVRGTYVTGLITTDIESLDCFEGDQYTRQNVKVRILKKSGGDGKTGEGNVESEDEVEAETYVWTDGVEYLEDKEWDFETFEREKMSKWAYGYVQGEFEDAETEEDKQAKLKNAYLESLEAAIEEQAKKAGKGEGEDEEPVAGGEKQQEEELLKSAV